MATRSIIRQRHEDEGVVNVLSAIRTYFRDGDPVAQARNTIAAVVLANIPFYPLYAVWLVGGRAWPTLLTFLSAPLFALVPALNRRSKAAGQWSLLVAGLVDTGLATVGLGGGAGLEAFLAPIALLPLVLYRDAPALGRILMLVPVAVVFVAGRMAPGFETFTPSELRDLTWLHFISAAMLCGLIFILWWKIQFPASSD